MDTPIIEELLKLESREKISFHTPGHKGKSTVLNWAKFVPGMDTTEVPGMDNLHNPTGAIKESQQLAAKAFGAKKTIYSINGSTGGIYIALGAITNPKDKILIQRESHKSIYNGAILNRLDLEYISTNYNEKNHIYTGINLEDLEYKLKEVPGIKVVVITYPNYYGICSDINKIAKIVDKYDKVLLIDEAHGSHFTFSDRLPLPSLVAGADIVVQSTHKTLPSLTQTSMVHIGSSRVNIDKLKSTSSLYQSTSPSYLFMASLEAARVYMEGEGKIKLSNNIDYIKRLIDNLQTIDGVNIFTGDEEDLTIHDRDITKLLVSIDGIRGTELSNMLMKDYGIYMEMSDFNYALALSSLMNEEEDFKELERGISEIAKIKVNTNLTTIDYNLPKAKIVLPIYEAFYSNKKEVDLEEGIGKVSASFIVPYPPGIPLICPGEEISRELVDYINIANDYNIEILGLMGYNREKIKVVE